MIVEAEKESSHWWWFDSHNKSNSNRSPWLQSTVAELDEKTKTILKLIEEDADSFAQRAEMYYKKRPELISMVEDFYRTHRSLAERYDQIKSDSGTRLLTQPWSSLVKYKLEKSLSMNDKAYDSYSEAYEPEDEFDESEVDDPEEDETEEALNDARDEEMVRLNEELERLREENKVQKEELMQKDEEKREVIRQLSLAMDMLRECVSKNTPMNENRVVFSKAKEGFLGRLFSGFAKSPGNIVPV